MPSLSTRSSSLVFVAALVGAIGLMMFLMFSIWQDGEEMAAEQGDDTLAWTRETDQALDTSHSQKTSPQADIAAVARLRQNVITQSKVNTGTILEPAPDFEPVETKASGE